MAGQAWYAHGYAVWSAAVLAALGVWVLGAGARRWPGALWRRLRGVAYVPGELSGANLWMAIGLLVGMAGASILAVEWGLRGFQSYEAVSLAGRLELRLGDGRIEAVWTDPRGHWAHTWSRACPRLVLEGEFVEWNKWAHAAGFRDRHRVSAGRLLCSAQGRRDEAGRGVRFGGRDAAWEKLRRWDPWLPILRTGRRESPALQVATGSWRVFVLPVGYAFSE